MQVLPSTSPSTKTPYWWRRIAFGALAAYGALLGVAMALYPGGTYFDRTTQGHDFIANFLCDLTRDVAHDGRPNGGAPFARASMIAMGAALVAFFHEARPLLPSQPRLARVVAALGVLAGVGMVAVTLAPARLLGTVLHAFVLATAGVPGLVAATLMLAGIARERPRPRRSFIVGIAALVSAAANAALYAAALAGAGELAVLPVVQKVALGTLVLWIVTVFRDTAFQNTAR